ncbi:MAG: hypothetical protein IT242_03620 [Bacteroidia bacterium]|nr:hypothetical protein [Bacteroidia bacterium]
MIKLFISFITAIFLSLMAYFTGDNVHVESGFPTVVTPGNEYIVDILVRKGDITGFSRLQYFLPPGFSAEAVETAGGQFIDEESSVKFIWIQLPADDTFRVSMKIKVSGDVKGLQAVNGLFTFILDNKTRKMAIPVVEIPVGEPQAKTPPSISRKLIAIRPEAGEYKVELEFHPSGNPFPARFIDNIPTGFTASAIESHGAEFSFENGKAVFRWDKLPEDSAFTISYMVNSTIDRTAPAIDGMLVYGDEPEDDLKPGGYIDDSAAGTTDPMAAVASENKNNPEDATASQLPSESGMSGMVAQLPAPQSGIYYKVQICATIRSSVKNTQWFHHRYHIADSVDLTYHEGWKKYLIGTFTNVKEATACRKKTNALVPDAFVVAYDNGQRISVSEAVKKKPLNQ